MLRSGISCARLGALCLVLATSLGTAQAQVTPESLLRADLRGTADHPLTGRYTGSVILAQTGKAFDELKLPSGRAEGQSYDNNKKFSAQVTAQGKVTRTIYIAPQGRSSLEVMTNFTDAVAAKGFEPVYRCTAAECGDSFVTLKYRWDLNEAKVLGENYEHQRRLMVDAVFDQLVDIRYTLFKKTGADGDSYVGLYGGLHRGGGFGNNSAALSDRVGVLVEIVEPRAMDRRMEVVSAAEIGSKVMADGKAIFYGIQFDFDKADIKPESEPQLGEMAKFLTANPAAKVFIVGHTDNKGTVDYNLGLSGRRADAVAKALVARHKIAAARLTPRGLGPLSPVASNREEDGRTKNRRVEMVEQ